MTTEEQGWISVTDKLPDEGQRCLIFNSISVEPSVFTKNLFYRYPNEVKEDRCALYHFDPEKVTHWTPLLKPPIKPLPIVDLLPDDVVDEKVASGEWQRAGGECICLVCKQEYQRHPNFIGRFYWLTQLCDGVLVKL